MRQQILAAFFCGVEDDILFETVNLVIPARFGDQMQKCGKVTGLRQEKNTVFVSFEHGELEVQILTAQIIRFFMQMQEERPASKAIEGDKSKETALYYKSKNKNSFRFNKIQSALTFHQ